MASATWSAARPRTNVFAIKKASSSYCAKLAIIPPIAIGGIIANLAQYEELAFFIANTLVLGLAADQVAEAITYLDPTLVFCCRCPVEQEVQRVVKEALSG